MIEIANNPSAIAIFGVLGTLLIGVITNAFWDYIKETYSFASSAWPNLRGEWIVTRSGTDIQNATHERVFIKQQFGAKFKGEVFTPLDDISGKTIVQIIRGELLDRYHAVYTLRQMGNHYTEMGAGLITIEPNLTQGTGKTVYFGVTTKGSDEVATFTMRKT